MLGFNVFNGVSSDSTRAPSHLYILRTCNLHNHSILVEIVVGKRRPFKTHRPPFMASETELFK